MLFQAGRLDETRVVICNLWGESEVERAVEEFQSVIRNDGSDLNSGWSELLEEPNSRGTQVTFLIGFSILGDEPYLMSLYGKK